MSSATWLTEWEPENEEFWAARGKKIATRTLIITTANLMVAFAVWFVVSAMISRLGKAGFDLSKSELYWLVAMPGLAGGTFRLIHMFLTPIYGTRHVVSISTALLMQGPPAEIVAQLLVYLLGLTILAAALSVLWFHRIL